MVIAKADRIGNCLRLRIKDRSEFEGVNGFINISIRHNCRKKNTTNQKI